MGAIRSRISHIPVSPPPTNYDLFSPSLCVETSQTFQYPKNVAVEEKTQNIFVTNSCGISIFTSSCQFITTFHHRTMVSLWGIALYEHTIYVTDYHNRMVLIFREDTGAFCTYTLSPGHFFHSSTNLAVSSDEIFIADTCTHSIVVMDALDLRFSRIISSPSMLEPIDVKLSPSELFVLSRNSSPRMHVFSHAGILLRAMDTRVRLIKDTIFGTLFFCLDPTGNILVSDIPMRSVMVYTVEGKLTNSLYMGTHERFLYGIAFVDKHSFIVCFDSKFVVYSSASCVN